MIQTKATNFGDLYWYCKTCKKELAEMQPKLEEKPCAHKAWVWKADGMWCKDCNKKSSDVAYDSFGATVPWGYSGYSGSSLLPNPPVKTQVLPYPPTPSPQCGHWSYGTSFDGKRFCLSCKAVF